MNNKNLQNLERAKSFLESNPTTIELLTVLFPEDGFKDLDLRDSLAELVALESKNKIILEKLSNSGLVNLNILTALSTNPNIDQKIFENLMNLQQLSIYEALAENKKLEEKQIKALFNLDIDSVDHVLASNPNLEEYMISHILEEYFIDNEDLSIAIAIATNPAITDEAFDALSDSNEIQILEALLLNPSLDEQTIEGIKIDISDLKLNEEAEIQHFENMRNGLA